MNEWGDACRTPHYYAPLRLSRDQYLLPPSPQSSSASIYAFVVLERCLCLDDDVFEELLLNSLIPEALET